jgi:hypothetical protein
MSKYYREVDYRFDVIHVSGDAYNRASAIAPCTCGRNYYGADHHLVGDNVSSIAQTAVFAAFDETCVDVVGDEVTWRLWQSTKNRLERDLRQSIRGYASV